MTDLCLPGLGTGLGGGGGAAAAGSPGAQLGRIQAPTQQLQPPGSLHPGCPRGAGAARRYAGMRHARAGAGPASLPAVPSGRWSRVIRACDGPGRDGDGVQMEPGGRLSLGTPGLCPPGKGWSWVRGGSLHAGRGSVGREAAGRWEQTRRHVERSRAREPPLRPPPSEGSLSLPLHQGAAFERLHRGSGHPHV